MDEPDPTNTLAIIAGQYPCVAEVVTDRERLRDKVRLLNERILADTQYAGELVTEQDRLRDALAEVYFHLGPPQDRVAEHTEVPRLVEQAMAERDQLRAVVGDAVNVLSAEWLDYDGATQVLADMRAALDRNPTGEDT